MSRKSSLRGSGSGTLNVSITRCSNNYGPYHFPEKVIPLFVTNLIDGKHVPLYGEGNNIRDWLHVDDHTRGIALVLFGGILLLASLMTSANWNGVPLDKMFSGEAQDQPTNSD